MTSEACELYKSEINTLKKFGMYKIYKRDHPRPTSEQSQVTVHRAQFDGREEQKSEAPCCFDDFKVERLKDDCA